MTLRKIFAAFLSAAVVATSAAIPVLADEPTTWDEVVTAKPDGYVEDAEAKTIEISSAEGLAWFSKQSNSGDGQDFKDYTVALTKNIDISAHEWQPIGEIPEYGFTGVFNGNKHTISGLTINSTEKVQGLFSYNTGTIENLTVEGSVTVVGRMGYVAGGIVGQNAEHENKVGKIENCHNKAAITGFMTKNGELMQGGYNIGGITGQNSGGTIIKCSNSGIIKGSYSVGGIVGNSTNSTIQDSYNTGDVICFYDESLSEYYTAGRLGTKFGGIVGSATNDLISNCYNTGNVTNDLLIETWLGTENQNFETGGIVGKASKVEIENCYNGGNVTAMGQSIGGIVGLSESCTLSDSYNDGKITGLGDGSITGAIAGSVGGTVGTNLRTNYSDLYYKEGTAEKGIGMLSGGQEFNKENEEDGTVNSFDTYEGLDGKLGDDWTFNEETGKPETKSNPVDKEAKKAAIKIVTAIEWQKWLDNPDGDGEADDAQSEINLSSLEIDGENASESGESQEIYIVAEMADDAERVLDFATLEFELFSSNPAITMDVTPGDGMTLERSLENEDIYTIHVLPGEDAEDGVVQVSDRLIIGKIAIGGYGSGYVQVRDAYVNSQISDSIVRQIEVEPADESTLKHKPEEEIVVNCEREYENSVDKTDVTVNVIFPNMLNNTGDLGKFDYTQMNITAKGGAELVQETGEDGQVISETAKYYERYVTLGSDGAVYIDEATKTESNQGEESVQTSNFTYSTNGAEVDDVSPTANGYTVNLKVPKGRLSLTFKGEGYSTYSFDTIVENDAETITVWNNVMDSPTAVIKDDATSAIVKTFLAGDIVEDNTINLYDLSAAVAYFGKTGAADAMKEYVKYDLNRDGKIDSKDIAMVLVSWDK